MRYNIHIFSHQQEEVKEPCGPHDSLIPQQPPHLVLQIFPRKSLNDIFIIKSFFCLNHQIISVHSLHCLLRVVPCICSQHGWNSPTEYWSVQQIPEFRCPSSFFHGLRELCYYPYNSSWYNPPHGTADLHDMTEDVMKKTFTALRWTLQMCLEGTWGATNGCPLNLIDNILYTQHLPVHLYLNYNVKE